MLARFFAFTAISLALSPVAEAQHTTPTPYAGFETRAIKALSAQQVEDLKAGRGMGLALPAELNGYPGPVHVLELTAQLALNDTQKRRMEELLTAMKAEAVPLGERLLAQEAELDRLFVTRTITHRSLTETTAAIAATQGELRATHLKYHLMTVEVLNPDQIRRYSELRGYASTGQHGGHARQHSP